jgi:hypothetical protein
VEAQLAQVCLPDLQELSTRSLDRRIVTAILGAIEPGFLDFFGWKFRHNKGLVTPKPRL